jgi:cobalt-zinc-cadmium efflux system outer membrane protein
MAWRLKAAGIITSLVFLSGCATVQLNAGFSDVSTAVEQRSALKVVWNNGSDLDREAEEKMRSLLRGKLTVSQAVQIALLNNREIQASYSDLGVAQADLVQAGLFKNPMFDAAVTFPISGGPPDLELTAVMNFLDIFYIPLRKRVAAARLEETKLRLTGAVLDFAGRVRRDFYVHQANEQLLELRQTIVQALSASLEVARRLHEAGNISDLDFARERALLERGKLALRSAESTVSQSREQLNLSMGLWGEDTNWGIERRLPDIPAQAAETEGLERQAIEKSIDLGSTRQRIVAMGEQLGLARSTALVLDWSVGTRGERQEGSWSVGPFFEFPIPLFDQGQGRTGRAAADLRRTQQEYYALAVRVRSAARIIRDRLVAARDRALYSRDILLPLQERILNEVQLQYNAMQLGVFDLLRAREQQIEAGVAYVEALRDHALAASDFIQLLNGRLPQGSGVQAALSASQIIIDNGERH